MSKDYKYFEKGSSRLREHRQSIPGAAYFLTTAKAPSAAPLDNPSCFKIIQGGLNRLQEEDIFEWFALVVMPDHIHFIIRLGNQQSLSKAIQRFKAGSGKEINQLARRQGSLWYPGYFDHAIRTGEKIEKYLNYMRQNPVRKGLVEEAEKWPYFIVRPLEAVFATHVARTTS